MDFAKRKEELKGRAEQLKAELYAVQGALAICEEALAPEKPADPPADPPSA